MGKRVIKQKITVAGDKLTVQYPTINKSLSVVASSLADTVRFEAMMHGLKQRLGDAESGKSPAEKYAMAERIVEAFESGSWELSDRKFDPSLVIEAVARLKKLAIDEIREKLEAKGEEGVEMVKEWKANSAVKTMMLKIQAERAEANSDESDADEIEI